jgi:protein TonB
MFDELVESSAVKKKTNTSWAVTLSVIVQCCILAVLILIPLIYTQALPKAMLSTLLVAPPPPPPPPPPPAAAPKVVVKPVARLITQGKLVAPRAIPKTSPYSKKQSCHRSQRAAARAYSVGPGSEMRWADWAEVRPLRFLHHHLPRDRRVLSWAAT